MRYSKTMNTYLQEAMLRFVIKTFGVIVMVGLFYGLWDPLQRWFDFYFGYPRM